MSVQPQKKRFSLFGNSKQTKIPPPSNPSLPTPTSSASVPSRSALSKNNSRNNSSTTVDTIPSQPPFETKISNKSQDVSRQDIHESIAYFKRIIMAAEAYRERSIKLSKDAKALAKAFRDYKDMKGVDKAFVTCLEATALFYDAFADVQGKLGDKIQKDFDNLHELFVKHNKRVARDEKVHDELIHDLEKQLKKTGNMYDKKFKKEDYPLSNHERYVNQLSELSTQIATTRAEEISRIRARERTTNAQVSAIIARFVEHQFNASNDVMSKCETKRDDVRRLALFAEEKAKENAEANEIDTAAEEDEIRKENIERQHYGLVSTDSLASAGVNSKDTNNNASINSSSNQGDNSSIVVMPMPEPQIQSIQIPVGTISMPEPDLQFTRQQDVLNTLYGDTYNQQTPTSERSTPIVPGGFPDGISVQREEGSVLRRPIKTQRELSKAQDGPNERPLISNTDSHDRVNSNVSRALPPPQFQDRAELDSHYDRDANPGYFRNNSPARMAYHDEEPPTPQSTRPSYMMRNDYGTDLSNPYDVYQVRSTLSRSQQLPRSLSPSVIRYKDDEEESLASPYSDSGYSTSRSADIPSCQHHYHFRLVSRSSPYATPPPSASTKFSGPARCDECGAWFDRPLSATSSSTLQRKPVQRDTVPREFAGRGSEYSALGSSGYRDDRPSMGSSYRRYTELPPSPERNVKDLARRYSDENQVYPQTVSPPPLPPSSESNRRIPRRLSDSAIQRFEPIETDYWPNRIIDRMEQKAAGLTAAEDEQRRLEERERRMARVSVNTNDGIAASTPAPTSGSASTRKPVDLNKYNNLLVKPQPRIKTQAGVRSAPVSPQSASAPPETQRGRELPRPPGPSKFTKRQSAEYGSSISVGGGEKVNGR